MSRPGVSGPRAALPFALCDVSPLGAVAQMGDGTGMSKPREIDLYPAIKTFLEDQGYVVKSEVGAADVVAVRGAEPPLIVELKLGFSLALFHQCIARLKVSDDVYLAVARQPGKRFARAVKENTTLARRLGLGLNTVRLSDGLVAVQCDPGPYAPRRMMGAKPASGS